MNPAGAQGRARRTSRLGEAGLKYAWEVDADDTVVLKVVADGSEAELVCGLLRSAGLECGYRDTEADDTLLEEFMASGPREILVHEPDLAAAHAVLAEAQS